MIRAPGSLSRSHSNIYTGLSVIVHTCYLLHSLWTWDFRGTLLRSSGEKSFLWQYHWSRISCVMKYYHNIKPSQSTQYIRFSFKKMNGVAGFLLYLMSYSTVLSYLKSMSSSNSWSSKISWREPFEQYSVMRKDCSKRVGLSFESVFCYSVRTNN